MNGKDLAQWYWNNLPKGIPRNPNWGRDGRMCKSWMDNGNTAEQFQELCRKGWELKIKESMVGPHVVVSSAHLIKNRDEPIMQMDPQTTKRINEVLDVWVQKIAKEKTAWSKPIVSVDEGRAARTKLFLEKHYGVAGRGTA